MKIRVVRADLSDVGVDVVVVPVVGRHDIHNEGVVRQVLQRLTTAGHSATFPEHIELSNDRLSLRPDGTVTLQLRRETAGRVHSLSD